MGTQQSTETKAEGNSNANNITIIEQLQNHSETLTILLSIIIIILVFHIIYKLYVAHRRGIQKQAIRKSRGNIVEEI